MPRLLENWFWFHHTDCVMQDCSTQACRFAGTETIFISLEHASGPWLCIIQSLATESLRGFESFGTRAIRAASRKAITTSDGLLWGSTGLLDILALQGNIPLLLRKIVQAPMALVWTSHLWRAWVTWAGGQLLKSSVIWNEHKQRGTEEKRECHCVQISCGRFGCCWCSVFLCINFSSKLPYLSLDDDLPLNRLYFFLIISPFGTSQSLPFSLSLAQV